MLARMGGRLIRRRGGLIGIGVAIAAAAVVALSVGGNGGPATLDPVAQAADATLHVSGARIALTMKIGLPIAGGPMVFVGSGYFNAAAQEGSMSMHSTSLPAAVASRLPGGAITEDAIFNRYTLYLRMPILASHLPNGKDWIKIDVGNALKRQYGFNPLDVQSGSSDPTQFLRLLRESHATAVGSATVRGVPTTEYRGTIDLHSIVDRLPSGERAAAASGINKLIAQLGVSTLAIDVWVDGSHRVRRMHMGVPTGVSGPLAGANFDFTMDLSDFGVQQTVTVPPASQVVDMTSLASGALGSG